MLGENGVIARIVGFLTILFIALKLLNVVSWSWWVVFSPMIIAALITVGILIGSSVNPRRR